MVRTLKCGRSKRKYIVHVTSYTWVGIHVGKCVCGEECTGMYIRGEHMHRRGYVR